MLVIIMKFLIYPTHGLQYLLEVPGIGVRLDIAGYAFFESPGISDDNRDNDNDGLTDERRDNDATKMITSPNDDPLL